MLGPLGPLPWLGIPLIPMSEALTFVLLIRHGENEWVAQKKLAGRTPGVHLNAKGRQQAQGLVARLRHVKLDAVYSSPLERCMETAQPVADDHDLPVTPCPGLLEVDYGTWQGSSLKKLSATPEWQRVQFHPSRFRFPDGEPLRVTQNRLVDAVERIRERHPHQVVAIFGHSDPIKSVLAYYLGTPLDLFQRIMIDTASISVLALREAGCAIVRMNDTGPVPELTFPAPANQTPSSGNETSPSRDSSTPAEDQA